MKFRVSVIIQILSLAAFFIFIIGMIGHIIDKHYLATWGNETPIALPTAISGCCLSICVWLRAVYIDHGEK